MDAIRYHPLLLFALSLVVMWLAAPAGAFIRAGARCKGKGWLEFPIPLLEFPIPLLFSWIDLSSVPSTSRVDRTVWKDCQESSEGMGIQAIDHLPGP